MQFDHTHISIRERNYLEILDLALQMVRMHWSGLLLALVVGAVPMATLNYFILSGQIGPNEIWNRPGSYTFWMTLLVLLEAPLATAPITIYLGQVTFHGSARPGRLFRDFVRSLPQLLLYQVVLRSLMALLFVVGLLIPYFAWPYLSEVILLERNPLRRHGDGRITTWRRSTNLHRQSGGDLFSRWIGAVAAGLVLIASIVWGLYTSVSSLTGIWADELVVLRWYLPLAAWLVLGFFAVVRFLGYLDLRIRREGWEVELAMRAEAARLQERMA